MSERDQDFEDARRGFIAALDPGRIEAPDGRVVWDSDAYDFLAGDCPETATPSLWRQSRLTAIQGLFEIAPRFFQVRGLDLSNMEIVEGHDGIIVIDPLISIECAAAGLALYREHRGDRPVTAVVYTHSHVDHFGGVAGVVSAEDVDSGRVPILAPEGFLEHAVRENAFAGPAMARRAGYMYEAMLERGPREQVGCGLGLTTSVGRNSLYAPTVEITETGQEETRRRHPLRLPAHPGDRGAGRDELPLPRPPGALRRRERDPHAPQHPHPARRAGPRRACLGPLPERDDRALRRRHRRALRRPSLADLGHRAGHRLPPQAARPLRLPPRPNASADQQGAHGSRDRRGHGAPAEPRARVALPRLLRLREPQREGDLPALHGLVRRQPRPPMGAPAGGARAPLREGDRRHRPDAGPRP